MLFVMLNSVRLHCRPSLRPEPGAAAATVQSGSRMVAQASAPSPWQWTLRSRTGCVTPWRRSLTGAVVRSLPMQEQRKTSAGRRRRRTLPVSDWRWNPAVLASRPQEQQRRPGQLSRTRPCNATLAQTRETWTLRPSRQTRRRSQRHAPPSGQCQCPSQRAARTQLGSPATPKGDEQPGPSQLRRWRQRAGSGRFPLTRRHGSRRGATRVLHSAPYLQWRT